MTNPSRRNVTPVIVFRPAFQASTIEALEQPCLSDHELDKCRLQRLLFERSSPPAAEEIEPYYAPLILLANAPT